jgi:hypothetical protein
MRPSEPHVLVAPGWSLINEIASALFPIPGYSASPLGADRAGRPLTPVVGN